MTASTINEDFIGLYIQGTDFTGLANEQGQQAIVANVKQKEAEAKEDSDRTRLAMAVAEAMRPETIVGSVKRDGTIVGQELPPQTLPEPRETVKAGIKAMGKGGRKAVFSELPFDAEDIPDGWDVGQDEQGGWWTAPKENRQEVAKAIAEGKPEDALGYVAPKPSDDEQGFVVTAKDRLGVTIQDVVTNAENLRATETQAQDVGSTVEIKTGQESLVERAGKLSAQVDDDSFRAMSVLEGNVSIAKDDSQGLMTVGVGFNMEQVGAESMWESAGVQQDFNDVLQGEPLTEENKRKLFKFTMAESMKKAARRSAELGLDWDTLPSWHKVILSDVAFNTGSVRGWEDVFLETDRKKILFESRRKVKKLDKNGDPIINPRTGKPILINTRGMDNRVVKLGLSLGIIRSVAEGKRLGLSLADEKDIDTASILKSTLKAQPRRVP